MRTPPPATRVQRPLATRVQRRLWTMDPRRPRLRRRVHRVLHGSRTSIIASNCIGGRISQLAGNPYRSPTVGLWFDPDSYLEFVDDLPHYLHCEWTEDLARSEQYGYPVATMGRVTVFLQHYASVDEARRSWIERAARVDLDDVVYTFTDMYGAKPRHLERFQALAVDRKIAFTARARPDLPCVAAVPSCAGLDTIDDLYTRWQALEPVLKGERLDLFR